MLPTFTTARLSIAFFGSSKLPQTVEAVILHALDDLDGKIHAI
jgi:hypothetical protein